MLDNKLIVITGGAGLIGGEFVRAVVKHGGTAVIADINEERGQEAREKLIRETGCSCIDFSLLDITRKDSITSMIDVLDRRYGRIDALVNNAYPRNQHYGRKFFDVEYEDFCENLSRNLGGHFLVSQQVAAYFKEKGGGNIVNISSIYGIIAPRFEVYANTTMTMPVEYAAIKSAVVHLTAYMAKYFKGLNIRVNAISPGGILDKQPESFLEAYRTQCLSKGMLDKSDIAGALVFLLSDLSTFVNGQNIIVDDGFVL